LHDNNAKNLPDHAGVFVPPPLLYVIFFVIGMLLQRVWPVGLLSSLLGRAVASACLTAGIGLGIWSVLTFRRAKTNVLPIRPSTAIVTDGPFRFTRNPMYLSLSLLYMGTAFWLDMLWPVLLLPVLLFLVQTYIIAREERYLERKFGGEYLQYRSRVRRWI